MVLWGGGRGGRGTFGSSGGGVGEGKGVRGSKGDQLVSDFEESNMLAVRCGPHKPAHTHACILTQTSKHTRAHAQYADRGRCAERGACWQSVHTEGRPRAGCSIGGVL